MSEPVQSPAPNTPTSTKKSVAAAAVVASTLGGVAAGAALFTPAIAGAQDDATEATPAPSRLEAALQPLVDDGTLDEAQRDAVVETLRGARPEGSGSHGPGRGGLGNIADALGLDGSELREALRNGESIADIAESQGIDLDSVVDTLIAGAEERLDAAVEAGRIDEAQAASMLEQFEERTEDLVNGEFQLERPRGFGERGFGGRGFGPDTDDGPDA